MNEPINVDKNSFSKVVLEAEVPVLVDFWAPWCGPCRLIAPHLEALAKEMSGKILVTKLNTDENPEIAGNYQISGIPTIIIFKKGEAVDRIVGAVPKDVIKDKVVPHLS
jgi:thioredoxin 1